ncbi:autorepressor SdpR family transcription factor [Sphingomonas morindae]|uniref:Autorepressor SdpR family transcription factor n=1 Tax=Sphingomonas morindae TaxID=1541170 RepID=A0ABY4X9J4_9SPHN|nr:autorepressor SdpR family transcription factor [Sphingomonas morindae]USI73583.1 autorepressor SdpR family transcription factor [Sphingomonas morindae]
MDAVFEALSHPTRRKVLEILKKGSLPAGELASHFDVAKPTMSAHFAKLKAAGLVQAEQQGASLIYSLNLSVLEEVVLGFMERIKVGQSAGVAGEAACPSEA